MAGGRPSKFSQATADTICERLALGESLREIVRDEAMPDQRTVYRWLLADEREEFRQQYARARELQADSLFEEMKEIADDGSNDWMEKFGKDGESLGWVVNGEAVQRSRIRLDDRRWRAGKLKPRKYGERTLLGSDPDNPLPSGFAIKLIPPGAKALPAPDADS